MFASAQDRLHWPDSARLDGARLRQLRLARRWTQETLARRAGVAPGTVMRLERGVAATCRSHTATRLAHAVGADFRSLVVKVDGYSDCMAYFSEWRRSGIVVADSAGFVVDLLTVRQVGGSPDVGLLRQTRWIVHPDARWREFLPHQWSIPVLSNRQSQRGASEDEARDDDR